MMHPVGVAAAGVVGHGITHTLVNVTVLHNNNKVLPGVCYDRPYQGIGRATFLCTKLSI